MKFRNLTCNRIIFCYFRLTSFPFLITFHIYHKSISGTLNTWTFSLFNKKVVLWSTCRCFLNSSLSLTLFARAFNTWTFSIFNYDKKNHVSQHSCVFFQVALVFNIEWHSTRELFLSSWIIMLWSICMCFPRSLWSWTLSFNMWPFSLFKLNNKSCYGQRACAFSRRSGLELWMTFISSKKHVMVNLNAFSQTVVVFNSEWNSTDEHFLSSNLI